MVDTIGEDELTGVNNEEIPTLKEELAELANNGRLDAYGYYLLVTKIMILLKLLVFKSSLSGVHTFLYILYLFSCFSTDTGFCIKSKNCLPKPEKCL